MRLHVSDKLLECLRDLFERAPEVSAASTKPHLRTFANKPDGRKPDSSEPGRQIMAVLKCVDGVLYLDRGPSRNPAQ